MFGRIEHQTNNIDQFLGERRIVRALEVFDPVRLEAVVVPHPLHQGVAATQRFGQRPLRPLRRVRRQFLRGLAEDLRFEVLTLRGRPTGPWCITFDPCQALRGKSILPRPDGPSRATQFDGDVLVLPAIRRRQHDLRALHQPCQRAPPPRPLHQRGPLFIGQQNGFRNPNDINPPCLEDQTPVIPISSHT